MPTETRVFESVDQSPEVVEANKAYFESLGVTTKVETSGTGDAPNPPAETTPPAAAAAPAPTGEGEGDEAQVDAETAADWDSAQTDGKRKSRWAKKRQEARDLKATNERLERELADLKAKPAAPAETKPGDTAPPAAGETKPPAAAAPDANATATFPEAEPVEPQYESFAAEEDQLLAYNKALSKYNREWSRWDRRRDAFDAEQTAVQARHTEEAQKKQTDRLTQLNVALTEVRTKHPDFDQATNKGEAFSLAIQGASTVIPGGLEAAYRLAKDPERLKQFNELTAETTEVNGRKVPTQRAWDHALYLLGQMSAAPASASAPSAGSPPAAVPSSSSQPREEPAAPVAARGRASSEPTRDQLSGDQRRDMLAKQLA